MSFLDKVARIRAELLGAASDMPAAQVVAAALPLMGIIPEPSWALPQITIMSRNTDARFYKTMDGAREKVNFLIFYDIDDEEVKTVLRAAEHGGDEDGAWVLLEPVAPVGGPSDE